eukprot:6492140-Amphidinium_carterae.4
MPTCFAVKAWTNYEKVVAVVGAQIDNNIKEQVENQVKEATIAMKCGLMLHAIDAENSKPKLRDMIRQPLKDLRTTLGSKDAEKDTFPSCVATKIADIMAMKST